ncbi:MAG: hypothetical protein HYS18_03225 [Burkholderiales bacterium]|nr:hypothetical protein [Burkholderiales bacterium]
MNTRGEANPKVDGVFAHQRNSTAYCPLKQSAAKPYRILRPVDPDEEAAQRLRASFFSHWKHHWTLMRQRDFAPFADIEEFIALIRHADQSGLWLYRHLEEWVVPYIFLALKDFPPIRGKDKVLRAEWIRFWFDARVRTIEDLWIHTNGDWRIVKAIYAKPRNGGVPGPVQLKSVQIPEIQRNFLSKPEPGVHPYQEKAMKAAFPQELGSA